jgi:arylsulfatase A-like enzyme
MTNPIRDTRVDRVASTVRMSAGTCLAWATCFGLAAGALQLLVLLLKYRYFQHRYLNVSHHFPWMVPVSGLLVVGVVGCIGATVGAVNRKGIAASLAIGAISFAAYLTVLFAFPIHTVACLILAAALAYQTARQVVPRLTFANRWVYLGCFVLFGLLLCSMGACFGRDAWASLAAARSRAKPEYARNVLLIVLDTVRARSLSLYGYDRGTTPNLDRLASRGVVFEQAYATAPWTAPSHASMFTGCWAQELSVGWERPLDRSRPTLAEFFDARGYATGGFVANANYCGYETGLARGFAHYEDYDVTLSAILLCSSVVERVVNFSNNWPIIAGLFRGGGPLSTSRKTGHRIGNDFLAWQTRQGGRPFFAFLNFYDAHHPYLPPEAPRAPFGFTPRTTADYWLLKRWWGLDKHSLSPRQAELARDSYDQCIAYLDTQVGSLVDELERRGVLSNTLVIITADHGESLGEHRLYGHGCSLYAPELHVPLLVLDPVVNRRDRVAGPASLRDLAATIVERVGYGAGRPFPGLSLARYWSSDASTDSSAEPPVISALESAPGEDPNHGASPGCKGAMVSVIAGGYHYIRGGDGREELFQVASDPGENQDVSKQPQHSRALDQLRRVPPG